MQGTETQSKPISNSASKAFFSQGFKSQEDIEKSDLVRHAFAHLYDALETWLPEGRYKAMVKTKLEEAALFATKSFTHQ